MRTAIGSFGHGLFCALVSALALVSAACTSEESQKPTESVGENGAALGLARGPDEAIDMAARAKIKSGRQIFRYETFGDEAFWGGKLKLHQAIAGEANGGVGAGISPAAALALGLKVDVDALPRSLQHKIRRGQVNLNDPATTLALLKLDAVIGVKGIFDGAGTLSSVGIQCSLCHSVVDDSFAPGIGHRLDGWPSRDLDVGAIVAAAPDLTAFTSLLGVSDEVLRTVLRGWGRGKFDAFVLLDGKATRPDGGSAAVLIPPLFGLEGVGLMTWNGWSGIGSWVPLVINLELHGQGVFVDRRLTDAVQFPVAAANGMNNVRHTPDLVTSKLPALMAYVQAIEPPKPPEGSIDEEAAVRGELLFTGKARCSNCHVPPLFTLPGWNLIPPSVIGVDSFHADRSPNRGYRVPPLRGIHTRTAGGFFHDGRFAQVADVVNHFNTQFGLNLSDAEKSDLTEFVRSL
jgi:hypothetical protein